MAEKTGAKQRKPKKPTLPPGIMKGYWDGVYYVTEHDIFPDTVWKRGGGEEFYWNRFHYLAWLDGATDKEIFLDYWAGKQMKVKIFKEDVHRLDAAYRRLIRAIERLYPEQRPLLESYGDYIYADDSQWDSAEEGQGDFLRGAQRRETRFLHAIPVMFNPLDIQALIKKSAEEVLAKSSKDGV